MSQEQVVRLAFLDVGQGDTSVISIPETREAVVVDCIDAFSVISYLEREKIKHLRGILITHLHLDHFSTVVELLDNLEEHLGLSCERILFHIPKVNKKYFKRVYSDEDAHSEEADVKGYLRKNTLSELLRWAKENRETYNNLTKQRGSDLPMQNIIELLHPWELDVSDLLASSLNDMSAVLKVKGIATSALLMGDLELEGWEALKKQNSTLQSDVLKFPHHGSWKDDTPQELLDTVNPSVVVISVGTNGIRYDHPNEHVLDSIAQRKNVNLMCTQVTKKCEANLQTKTSGVKTAHEAESERSGCFQTQNTSGCPCAGTIVVELGKTVNILQPNPRFHQNLIKRHFTTPKCVASSVS